MIFIDLVWLLLLLLATVLIGRFAFRDLFVKSFGVGNVAKGERNIVASVIVIASMVVGFGVMIAKIIFDYKLQGVQYNIFNIVISVVACWLIIFLTKAIFDRTVVKSLVKNAKPCSVSVAIVDAGNILGTSIIVTKVLSWSSFNDTESIVVIAGVLLIAQIATILLTYVRKRLLGLRNTKFSLQRALSKGNNALAIRFAGRIVGNSIVVSSIVNTIPSQLIISEIIMTWIVLSVLFIGIVYLVSVLFDMLVMYSINTYREIVEKNNVAVASLQAIIYIAIGVLFHLLWSAN